MTNDKPNEWTEEQRMQLRTDLAELHTRKVTLDLDGGSALLLLTYLQQAARNATPELPWGDPGNPIMQLAQVLQNFVSFTPTLAHVAALGWENPIYLPAATRMPTKMAERTRRPKRAK